MLKKIMAALFLVACAWSAYEFYATDAVLFPNEPPRPSDKGGLSGHHDSTEEKVNDPGQHAKPLNHAAGQKRNDSRLPTQQLHMCIDAPCPEITYEDN